MLTGGSILTLRRRHERRNDHSRQRPWRRNGRWQLKLQIGTTEAGKPFTLPADAVTQTFGILARKGAGKTNTAVVMAEEMLDRKNPIVVLDPLGCWHGLRSDASGTKPGYPVLIMGGEHADVPLTPESGAVVADFLVKDRVPTILDVSLFGENQMRRFVGEFADRFYRTNRDAVHWFVDEADEFAPQQASGGEIAKCLGAMQNVVRRGRFRGIGVTLISQRSAVLSKSVLTQTECLIALQTTGPQDLKAIGEWIKYHANAAECDRILSTLPKFQRGEAWVYSPGWLGGLQRVQVRARHTFDTSGTPKAGETRRQAKTVAEINLDKLSDSIRKTVEDAKANDPAALRRRVSELERQLAARPAAKPGVDPTALKRAAAELMKPYKLAANKAIGELRVIRESLSRLESKAADAIQGLIDAGSASVVMDAATAQVVKVDRPAPQQPIIAGPGDGSLSSLERSLLVALAQHPKGLTKGAAIVFAGYKPSGDISMAWSRFNSEGWIERTENGIRISTAGLTALGSYDPLPTGAELREYWKSKSTPVEAALLNHLFDIYPSGASKGAIVEAAGYRPSGDISMAWSKFNTLGFIKRTENGVRAADMWFQE